MEFIDFNVQTHNFSLSHVHKGMITGYVLYRVKEPPKIPHIINFGLWLLSLFTLGVVIFGVGGGQLSLIATSFYVSIGHTGKIMTRFFPFSNAF